MPLADRQPHMVNLAFSHPTLFLLWFAAVAVTITAHEFAHAAAAVALGDETPRRMGRLTLNPLAHAHPLGTIMMHLVGFGWANPVPFNPYNLRVRRWGPSLVAVAGPAANLAFVILFGILHRSLVGTLPEDNLLMIFSSFLVVLSAGLLLFNLIPIPPLDGSKFLLAALAGPEHARTRMWLETQGPYLLIVLIILDNLAGIAIFDRLLGWPLLQIIRLFGI